LGRLPVREVAPHLFLARENYSYVGDTSGYKKGKNIVHMELETGHTRLTQQYGAKNTTLS